MEPDQVLPDQVLPDQVLPDQVLPDQVLPDQVLPDQVLPDQVLPDQVLPDQVLPDQVLPDQVLPDQVLPDQVLPDQVEPDQSSVPFQAVAASLALTHASGSTWRPSTRGLALQDGAADRDVVGAASGFQGTETGRRCPGLGRPVDPGRQRRRQIDDAMAVEPGLVLGVGGGVTEEMLDLVGGQVGSLFDQEGGGARHDSGGLGGAGAEEQSWVVGDSAAGVLGVDA